MKKGFVRDSKVKCFFFSSVGTRIEKVSSPCSLITSPIFVILADMMHYPNVNYKLYILHTDAKFNFYLRKVYSKTWILLTKISKKLTWKVWISSFLNTKRSFATVCCTAEQFSRKIEQKSQLIVIIWHKRHLTNFFAISMLNSSEILCVVLSCL